MYSEQGKDEIRIEKLEVYAYHGVYPEERKRGQIFLVNTVLYTDTHRAGTEDKVELSTDYGAVSMFIDRWMKENTCHTLEAVAGNLAREILLNFDLINALDLEILKPEAPIPLTFGCVSVKIHRSWHKAYLSVGSIRRCGPRTLDLDILFFDQLVYESDTLVIPHPDLHNREFVLKPLSTIAPNYRHPLLGMTVSQELAELEKLSLPV